MDTPKSQFHKCRTCMMRGQDFSSIFEDAGNSLKICDMLTTLQPKLLIHVTDQLPHQLCEPCLTKLNIAYEFQQMCIASDKQMRNDLIKNSTPIGSTKAFVIQTDLSTEDDPLLDELIKFQEYIEVEAKDDALVDLTEIEDIIEENGKISVLDSQSMYIVDRENQFDETEYSQDTNDSLTGSCSAGNDIQNETDADGIEKTSESTERLQCPLCPKTFVRQFNLQRHVRTHSKDHKKYPCEICHSRFSTYYYLEQHKTWHNYVSSQEQSTQNTPVGSFKCRECPRHFEKAQSRSAHMQVHRRTNGIQIYQCDLCPKFFYKLIDLTIHNRTHPEYQKFKCTQCEKKFATRSLLTDHLKKHKGDKLFTCDICNKEFYKEHLWLVHQTAHTDETAKPFECSECDRRFCNKRSLRIHLLRHSDVKMVECPKCPSKFICAADLSKHMPKHERIKRFKCAICKLEFTYLSSLKRHKLIHTTERPFKCNICEMSFIYETVLKRHMRTHKGEEPKKRKLSDRDDENGDGDVRSHVARKLFKCDQCPTGFKRKKDLRNHLNMHYKKLREEKLKNEEQEEQLKQLEVEVLQNIPANAIALTQEQTKEHEIEVL